MTDRWKCLVSRPKTALLSHISLKTTEYTDSGANFRLILPQYKESSPAPFSRGKAKIALFPKRKLVTLVFSFVAIIGLISAPAPANAGLLSFVAGLFDNNSADEALPKEENSQNMPLLKAALNLDPNPAKGGGDITVVGGVALLPDTGPSGTIADIEDEPLSSDNISLYVVRAGDSLSGIAKLFGVSANTILWANDIKKGQAIQPGQTLVILPVSGVQHTVVAGETVRSIAKNIKGKRRKFLISTAFTPTRSLPLEMLLLFLTAKLAFRIRRTEVPLVSYQKNRRAEQTMYLHIAGIICILFPAQGIKHRAFTDTTAWTSARPTELRSSRLLPAM